MTEILSYRDKKRKLLLKQPNSKINNHIQGKHFKSQMLSCDKIAPSPLSRPHCIISCHGLKSPVLEKLLAKYKFD